MSNKIKKDSDVKASQKKINFLPVAAGAAAIVCAAVVFLANGSKVSNESGDTGRAGNGTAVIGSGESLMIPTGDITTDVSFFPLEIDGTKMEIIAVRANDGTIRTAFNTCQSCYTSGQGFYVQEGSDLVCQNCGFHFTADEVEVISGGCNPWPIFEEDKTVTDDAILISYDYLAESQNIFANWRVN